MSHAHHLAMESSGFRLSLVALALAGLYLRGWLKLRPSPCDSVPAWRAASFILGILSTWIAVGSPIAALDHDFLTAHMIQHLLLMTVAAPLILLGEPALTFYGLSNHVAPRVLDYLLRSKPLQDVGGMLTLPAFCWLAATAALICWHVPAIFNLGMQSDAWHAFQQASFFVTGLLFWWPVLQPWPTISNGQNWTTVLYLFLATLPCDALSGFLVFSNRVVYPVYHSTSRQSGFSVLADQQCAGAVMWTSVTVIYLVAAGIIATRLLSPRTSEQIQSVGA